MDVSPLRDLLTVVLGVGHRGALRAVRRGWGRDLPAGDAVAGARAPHGDRHRPAVGDPGRRHRHHPVPPGGLDPVAGRGGHRAGGPGRVGGREPDRASTSPARATCSSWPPPACWGCRRTAWAGGRCRCPRRSLGRRPTRPRPPTDRAGDRGAGGAPRWAATRRIGAVSGLLSGLLGIGGGVIMVPAFVQLARLEVKSAIATSLVCVGLFAVPGHDHPRAAGSHRRAGGGGAGPRGGPGARLGAALTIRASDGRLRVTVASFLGLTAVLYASGSCWRCSRRRRRPGRRPAPAPRRASAR